MKNRYPLPLNALRVFRAAAEAGSFKAAASQLFVTQAAVSQQIRSLEEYLQQPLFQRRNREVVLNDAGTQLLRYVQQGLDILEQGVQSLNEDNAPNTLRISALSSFASRWLVPRLGSFQQQNPDISVQLSPSEQLVTFADGQTDLALRFGRGDYPGLSATLLGEDFLLPLCNPALLQADIDPRQQMQQLPLLYDYAPELPGLYHKFLQALGLDPAQCPDTPLTLSNSGILVDAVLAGQGYGLLRFSLAQQLLESGLLCCPLPCYIESPLRYYLVAPETHMNRPKVQRFHAWLQGEMNQTRQAWQQFHSEQLQGQPPLVATTL